MSSHSGPTLKMIPSYSFTHSTENGYHQPVRQTYKLEICCPLVLFLLTQWADSNLNQAEFSLPEAGGQVLIPVTGLFESLDHPDIPGWWHLNTNLKFHLMVCLGTQ